MRVKRNLTWLMSTLTVVVLLFGYKTSTGGEVATGTSVISSVDSAAAQRPSDDSSSSSSGDGSGSSTGSSSSSGSSGSAPSGSSGTVTGDSVATRWGPVQVAVSVSGGKVTDVQVVDYPSENPRDAEINSYALPILVQETIDAQSADIDMVSGATVTSDGYVRSLQSAQERAGV